MDFNADTWIIWILWHVPMVSIVTGFHCTHFSVFAFKQVTKILNFNVSGYQSPHHQGVSPPTNMLLLCVHETGNIWYD